MVSAGVEPVMIETLRAAKRHPPTPSYIFNRIFSINTSSILTTYNPQTRSSTCFFRHISVTVSDGALLVIAENHLSSAVKLIITP
jgi:hypothetical protein